MSVFVVMLWKNHMQEFAGIHGVYDSQEKAEEAAKKATEGFGMTYVITQREVA